MTYSGYSPEPFGLPELGPCCSTIVVELFDHARSLGLFVYRWKRKCSSIHRISWLFRVNLLTPNTADQWARLQKYKNISCFRLKLKCYSYFIPSKERWVVTVQMDTHIVVFLSNLAAPAIYFFHRPNFTSKLRSSVIRSYCRSNIEIRAQT